MPKPFGETLSRSGWDCGKYPLYCHESGALSKGEDRMLSLSGGGGEVAFSPLPALSAPFGQRGLWGSLCAPLHREPLLSSRVDGGALGFHARGLSPELHSGGKQSCQHPVQIPVQGPS